jgi:NTE family protein
MIFLPILASVLLAATPAVLAASDGSSAPADRPVGALRAPVDRECVGLVLGGGGARGAAHVGVLEVLERERVPICVIAGTSMGAVVGSLYASGYRAAEIRSILETVRWSDLFTDDPVRTELPMRRKEDQFRYLLNFRLGFREGRIVFPRGAIQGQKFMLMLRRLLLPTWNVTDFDQLPIPFRAVATDIETGEPVVFGSGDLASAVRASLSVPGAFAPIRVDGRLMVDGGLVDNVPIDVARAMGATRLIVVDVSAPLLRTEELGSPVAVTWQMISVLINQRTNEVLAGLGDDDLLIRPSMPDLSSAQFDRAPEAIAAGLDAAEAMAGQIAAFGVAEAEYAGFVARHHRSNFDPPLVAFLEVVENRSRSPELVRHQLAGLEGEPLDVDRLEHRIGRAYGYGQFERITWKLAERDGEKGVVVTPVDKGWGPSFITFGLQLSDDFAGRSDYQLTAEGTFTGRNFAGGEWRNRIQIGALAGLRSEWFQPIGSRAEWFAVPSLDYRAEQVPVRVDGLRLAEYRLRRAEGAVELGWSPDPAWQLTAGVLRGWGEAERLIGDPIGFLDFQGHYGAVTGGFTLDTLDDARFPRRGTRIELDAEAFRAALGSDDSGELVSLIVDHAIEDGPNRWLLGFRGQASWGEANDIARSTFLGGFTNLSGYTERELIGTQSALGRAVYYRQFGDAEQLFSMPAYIGASLEVGNVWERRDQISLGSLIVSGSLFVGTVTPFGPVFLGYGRADSGAGSWYLTFGSLLRPRR